MAFGTVAAPSESTAWIRAETRDRTGTPVGTVVERMSIASGLLKKKVVTDFLGNSSAVSS